MEDDTIEKSAMMDVLYGSSADEVYRQFASLDPKFNELVQRFAYDQVWQLPPLSVKEKSLITVAALVAMRQPEGLRFHITAFLNCGGTVDELRALITHLSVYCGFPASLAAFGVLAQVLADESPGIKQV